MSEQLPRELWGMNIPEDAIVEDQMDSLISNADYAIHRQEYSYLCNNREGINSERPEISVYVYLDYEGYYTHLTDVSLLSFRYPLNRSQFTELTHLLEISVR